MKEILSQEEIASLMNCLDEEAVFENGLKNKENGNVKLYDFTRPIKLSKEYINTLHLIFENYSKLSANELSTLLRKNVTMSLDDLEQISFDQFSDSLPNLVLAGIFQSRPLHGSQVLEISPDLGMRMLEILCGGSDGEAVEKISKTKFTDIELGILEDTFFVLLKTFQMAWKDIVEIYPELDVLETNPQLIQNMSSSEPVLLTTLKVDINGFKSKVRICVPYVSVENILDKLSMKNWFDAGKSVEDSRSKDDIEESLMGAQVDLTVELGKTVITVDDFMHLEKGDIVQLDMKTSAPMRMYVEDKARFIVRPGDSDGELAVQILQYVEEDV